MSKVRAEFEKEMGFEMLRFTWSESEHCYLREDGSQSPTMTGALEMFELGHNAATEAAQGGEAVFEVRLGAYDDDGTRPATLASLTDADLESFSHGTKLYTQPPAPVVPECPYHCGWHALHSIAVKRAAYFARVTIDDDYPEAVRSAGIELGEYAVSLTRAMLNSAPENDQ